MQKPEIKSEEIPQQLNAQEGGGTQGATLCVGAYKTKAVSGPRVYACRAGHEITANTMEVRKREHHTKRVEKTRQNRHERSWEYAQGV